MTTNLLPLLSRLAEAAPEMCQQNNQVFSLGGYRFWMQGEVFGFTAYYPDDDTQCYGQPALDWLTGALMAAIEARGWEWEAAYRAKNNTDGPPDRVANIWLTVTILVHGEPANTLAEALLAALIAAVEAERVR